jgi:hypothetical protein
VTNSDLIGQRKQPTPDQSRASTSTQTVVRLVHHHDRRPLEPDPEQFLRRTQIHRTWLCAQSTHAQRRYLPRLRKWSFIRMMLISLRNIGAASTTSSANGASLLTS